MLHSSLPRDFYSFSNLKSSEIVFKISSLLKTNDVTQYQIIFKELEGLSVVEASKSAEYSINYIIRYFPSVPMRQQKEFESVLQILMKHLEDDDKRISIISKIAVNTESQVRAVAPHLIKNVEKQSGLKNCILSLALDRVAIVRKETIKCLIDSHFDKEIVETLIVNGVNDRDDNVKNTTAAIIGLVAPHMIKEYCSLLESPVTCNVALLSISKFASIHGIKALEKSLSVVCELCPNEASVALIEASKYANQDEFDTLILIAQQLTKCELFMVNFIEFLNAFPEKEKLLSLLSIKNINSWRQRALILRNCIELVNDFPEQMADQAINFSCDDVAIVRTLSIELWKKLIEKDPKYIYNMQKLLKKGWQERLIVAKAIGKLDNQICKEMIDQLLNDQVENVRRCMNEQLQA